MKKDYKKIAFTLAEGFICFILMGLLFVASITHLRHKDNYNKLYYTAYNTLLQAAGNIELEWNPNCICSSEGMAMTNFSGTQRTEEDQCFSEYCWSFKKEMFGREYRNEAQAGARWSEHYRDYPGFLLGDPNKSSYDGTGTDHYFCKKLTSKINTLLEESECQNFITLERLNPQGKRPGSTQFFNRHHAFTYAMPFFDMFPNIMPSFVAANGQRFYISSPQTANRLALYSIQPDKTPPSRDLYSDSVYRQYYRFVVVDLNGSKGPNTQFKNGATDPDLVLFAINAKGKIIPLGIPEFDKLYLDTQVYYADGTKSKTMSLFEAKAKAWGYEYNPGATENTGYMNQGFIENNGLSHSHIFYHNALNCALNGYHSSSFDISYMPNQNGFFTRNKYGGSCLQFEGSETSRFVDPLYTILVMQFLFHYNDCRIAETGTIVRGTGTENYSEEESKCFPYNNFQNPDNSLSLLKDKGCVLERDASTNKCSVDAVH